MIHFIKGEVTYLSNEVLIKNDYWGIKGIYFGNKNKGEFFLVPFLDTNHNNFYYAIFDNEKQIKLFNKIIKISGIGVKTANYISTFFSVKTIKEAINKSDLEFFKQIPGIGEKTAKKIIIELKDKFKIDELEKITSINKQKRKVIQTLINLGYPKSRIIEIINTYKFEEEKIEEIIQSIIKKL